MPDEQQNNNGNNNNEKPARPQIFSDQFIEQIGEEMANKIVDQLCIGLTQGPPGPQPATSLCLELVVFELEEDILRELVNCVFKQFNPILLTQEIMNILQQVNHILNGNSAQQPTSDPEELFEEEMTEAGLTPPASEENSDSQEEPAEDKPELNICKFELLELVRKKLYYLKCEIADSCHLRDAIFEEILLRPKQLPSDKLDDIYFVTEHVLAQKFRTFLIQQYDNFALKLCNKVSCINSDIEFLGSQIKLVTTNFPSAEKGIIEIADAAGSIARAFFSEEDDFDEIFDAVDEVAELIEDLAELYELKLKQLDHLLFMAPSGCPLPIEARETLPTIPEVPPPPPIFPVVGLPSSTSISSLFDGL